MAGRGGAQPCGILISLTTMDFRCWISDFGAWILDFGFRMLGFGGWSLDFGVRILVLGGFSFQIPKAIDKLKIGYSAPILNLSIA